MATSDMYRHPTRSEIIELAVAEGHDADIPGNAGSIHQVPSHTPTPQPLEKPSALAKDKDVEKGEMAEFISSETETVDNSEDDPNIVFWDGPDDPQNPMNWPHMKKWGAVCLVSAITFLTPLASSMFAPGVPQVMETYNSDNDMIEQFMVSVYVLGFASGPMIIAPLSEMYGRLPLYYSCNALFIIFTVAAAVASSMSQFIVFRFFMGCFGGAPLVLGGGTIADLISREQRGTAMVVWMMGPTIGPCVGPIIGGFLTVAKGWRWNFWFVAIVAGALMLMSMVLMKETSAPVILERKAKRLRAETNNPKLRSKLASDLSASDLFKFSIIRPAKMLMRSTICIAMSVYIAITYSYVYILFTTFTAVFKSQYNWKNEVVGLAFMGIGIGSLIGQFMFTYFGNRAVDKHIKRGDFKPEHRLYTMCVGGFALPIGLFWYGWSVQLRVHWIVPNLGTGLVGVGLNMILMPATTYLVDVFTVHAASAMAASTVLRSLSAALLPLSSSKMYKAMGYGWGNSLLGFVSLVLIPIPFLFIRYGEKIRARSTYGTVKL